MCSSIAACAGQDELQSTSASARHTPEALSAQQRILSQLVSLRTKAWQLAHQNKQASQHEQLSRQDLVVDVAGMGQLQALGHARVEALRASILRSGWQQNVIWGRLKELGWDGMEVQQGQVAGIKSTTTVSPCLQHTRMHARTHARRPTPVVPVDTKDSSPI